MSESGFPPALKKLWHDIIVAIEAEDFPKSANLLQLFLRQAPGYAPGWSNLGTVMRRLRLWSAAEGCFRRALALPNGATEVTYSNLGNVLRDMGRFRDSEGAFLEAMKRGGSNRTRYNYSLLLRDMNQVERALELISPVVAENPDSAQHMWDYSLMLLQTGNWDKGWAAYEARWGLPGTTRPDTGKPAWQGEDLNGKSLVIVSEQGMGDAIQFARYIPLIPVEGAKISFVVREPLLRLMRSAAELSHVSVLAPDDIVPEHDYVVPLLTIPRVLKAQSRKIPPPLSFQIAIDAQERAGEIFAPRHGRTRLGLLWAGSKGHRNDYNRSCPIQKLAPILADPRWDVYSLQVQDNAGALLESGFGVLCHDLSRQISDFYDTAAFMQHLDMFLTVDTGPAHLAGSLGLRTVLMTPESVDWRWGVHRMQTPWYSSMTLLHQPTQGDWESVITAFGQQFP